MSNAIVQHYATGEEINEVVCALEEALNGIEEPHAVMGMLSLVILMMHPYVTPEQLQKAVEQTSNYICLLCDEGDVEAEAVDEAAKKAMN